MNRWSSRTSAVRGKTGPNSIVVRPSACRLVSEGGSDIGFLQSGTDAAASSFACSGVASISDAPGVPPRSPDLTRTIHGAWRRGANTYGLACCIADSRADPVAGSCHGTAKKHGCVERCNFSVPGCRKKHGCVERGWDVTAPPDARRRKRPGRRLPSYPGTVGRAAFGIALVYTTVLFSTSGGEKAAPLYTPVLFNMSRALSRG